MENQNINNVIVANHAGLFVAWMLDQAGKINQNDTVILKTSFWLDRLENNLSTNWGQGTEALPFVFIESNNIQKTLTMNFADVKLTRSAVTSALIEKGYNIVNAEKIKYTDQIITITSENDTQLLRVLDGANWRVWSHTPRKPPVFDEITLPYISDLMNLTNLDSRTICFTGCGNALRSFFDHLKTNNVSTTNTQFYVLDIFNKPCNYQQTSLVSFDNTKTKINEQNFVTYEMPNQSECLVYLSSGFDLLKIDGVPNTNNRWPNKDTDCKWIAPKEYPHGCLPHSLAMLTQTEEMFLEEYTLFPPFYCAPYYEEQLTTKLLSVGIGMEHKFFAKLSDHISSASATIIADKMQRLQIYLSVFKETYGVNKQFYDFGGVIAGKKILYKQITPDVVDMSHKIEPQCLESATQDIFLETLQHNLTANNICLVDCGFVSEMNKWAVEFKVVPPVDRGVFYTGRINFENANIYAADYDKYLISNLPGASTLNNIDIFQYCTYTQAIQTWEILSESFASNACGTVDVFANSPPPGGVFTRIEFPALLLNDCVDTIVFWELI